MAASKDNIQQLLAEADKARGFPAGTMASLMKQESGGSGKFLDNPEAYHYGLNAEGKRIAGHTGKVSTAFGPFGILESTGRDPGYGVAPLKDKSLGEQIRFAADYLAGRSKQAGGLAQGLAGYGEGEKYAKQVLARRDGERGVSRGSRGGPATPMAPAGEQVLALAAPPAQEVVPEAGPPQLAAVSPSSGSSAPVQLAQAPSEDVLAWQRFQEESAKRSMVAQASQDQAGESALMTQRLAAIGGGMPQFQTGPMAPRAVDFRAFGNWGRA